MSAKPGLSLWRKNWDYGCLWRS